MAEGSSEEKKHDPTERRLNQAAEQGNVKRSQDFPKAAVTCALVVGAITGIGTIATNFAVTIATWLRIAGVSSVADSLHFVLQIYELLGPVVILLAAISMFSSILTGGWVFNLDQLSFDFSKMMPSFGFGQVFSMNGFIETGKNLIKVIVIGGTGAGIIFVNRASFATFAAARVPAPSLILELALQVLIGIGIVVCVLGVGDLALQYWMHRHSLRMTDSEMREEMKDVAGNPHVKSQQRKLARKMSKSRQLKRVPEAQVIVTNPTHFAVAIQYRKNIDQVPMLLAKGQAIVAQEIIDIARGAGVPIVQMPPLARAVYWYVEPDEPVPQALYRACAEVLAYVRRLDHWKRSGGNRPRPPKAPEGEFEVPGKPQRPRGNQGTFL